jgi:hypothetical protein
MESSILFDSRALLGACAAFRFTRQKKWRAVAVTAAPITNRSSSSNTEPCCYRLEHLFVKRCCTGECANRSLRCWDADKLTGLLSPWTTFQFVRASEYDTRVGRARSFFVHRWVKGRSVESTMGNPKNSGLGICPGTSSCPVDMLDRLGS